MQVIEFAKKLGIKDLGLAFTLNNENFGQTRQVFNFCRKNKLNFSMAVAQNSDFYFGGNDYKLELDQQQMKKELQSIIESLLRSFAPRNWARAYFVNGLMKVAKGEKRPLESRPGEDFFYLDPKGDVYPSVADNLIMGNITEYYHFKNLWASKKAQKARDDLKGYESNYWFVCTARTGMKRNPLKVMKWVLSKKFKPTNFTLH